MTFSQQDFTVQFSVTPEIYEGFMTIFKDRNPMHTDKAFSKSFGFSDKIMQGNILNGFLSFFIGECLPVKNVIIQSQKIRFIEPVYLHDQLTLKVTVKDFFESVNTAELEFIFFNQHSRKVAQGQVCVGVLV